MKCLSTIFQLASHWSVLVTRYFSVKRGRKLAKGWSSPSKTKRLAWFCETELRRVKLTCLTGWMEYKYITHLLHIQMYKEHQQGKKNAKSSWEIQIHIRSRFLNRIYLMLIDASPDHTTGIFEGVPRDGSIVDGEFEICDRPHLPTYNLPVLQSDELTSGYVRSGFLGSLKSEPRDKLL